MSCKYKETDRSWLYIMVFITMVTSCEGLSKLKMQDKKIQALEQKLDKLIKQ